MIYQINHTILTKPKWQQYRRVLFIRTPQEQRCSQKQKKPSWITTNSGSNMPVAHASCCFSMISSLKAGQSRLMVCMFRLLWPSVWAVWMTDSPADSAECRVCGTVALEVFFPFFFCCYTQTHIFEDKSCYCMLCSEKKRKKKYFDY